MERNFFIADSQPLMAESICHLLTAAFKDAVTVWRCDASQILPSVKDRNPAFIIFDPALAKPDGLKCAEQIRKACPVARLLVFSDDDDSSTVKAYFKKGVHGYLLRKSSGGEFLNAVVALESGETFLDTVLQQKFSNEAVGQAKKKKLNLKITVREREILRLVVDEHTTKEIARLLFICPETVETHRLNLTQKFGVRNTAGLVREAILRGALLDPGCTGKP